MRKHYPGFLINFPVACSGQIFSCYTCGQHIQSFMVAMATQVVHTRLSREQSDAKRIGSIQSVTAGNFTASTMLRGEKYRYIIASAVSQEVQHLVMMVL
jgi:hypothetical protein